jgi:hypothetical protein
MPLIKIKFTTKSVKACEDKAKDKSNLVYNHALITGDAEMPNNYSLGSSVANVVRINPIQSLITEI